MDSVAANSITSSCNCERSVMRHIDQDDLPMALGEVMAVLGRAAAGKAPSGDVPRSVTFVAGDSADVDNHNA